MTEEIPGEVGMDILWGSRQAEVLQISMYRL